MDNTTAKSLKKSLLVHAHALNIPEGAAEDFINAAIDSAQKSLTQKSVVTPAEYTHIIAKSLRKYHRDLAYIYEIYETII